MDYASKNGVFMLSFTLHCSHKLQYLDRTVYGQLYKSCESWMHYNPGKAMTIYDTQRRLYVPIPIQWHQQTYNLYIIVMRVSLLMMHF